MQRAVVTGRAGLLARISNAHGPRGRPPDARAIPAPDGQAPTGQLADRPVSPTATPMAS